MDIEELIKSIAIEVLSKLKRKVLLFITGGSVNIKEVFMVLKENSMIQYSIVMSDAALKVIPKEYIESIDGKLINEKSEMTKEINKADLIVIPILTRNTLSKISNGISDNLVTLGISEAIMMNKKIIAVKDSFDPNNSVNIYLGYARNKAYNEMLLNYLKVLEDMGIEFINAEELKNKINDFFNFNIEIKKNNKVVKKIFSGVLTLEDILSNNGKLEELCIQKGTIISPLALDYVNNNKIKICYVEKKE